MILLGKGVHCIHMVKTHFVVRMSMCMGAILENKRVCCIRRNHVLFSWKYLKVVLDPDLLVFSPFSLRSKYDKYQLKSYEISTAYRKVYENSEDLNSFCQFSVKEFEEL